MKFLKKIIKILILIIVIAVIVVGYKGYNKYKVALEKIQLQEKVFQIREDKNYTKLEELPKMYKDAVLAIEDHRFYSHGAIDIRAILRAGYVDITTLSLREGGSTITQQLAKNIYFTRRKNCKQKNSRDANGF